MITETVVQPASRARTGAAASILSHLDRARPAWIFLVLYAVALVVDITVGLASIYRHSPGQLEADEMEYWSLSSQLLDGSFLPSPRRTAAYPLILAAARLVGSSFLGVQLLITAIFALSAPLVFLLARKLSGGTATGAVAGLLFAFWPPTAFYGASLYSEPVALPLFLIGLWLMPPGSRVTGLSGKPEWRAAFATGLVLAITTQVRSMYLLFLPVALLAIVLEEQRFAIAARRGLALLAGFMLLTLPWSAYMTTRFHHPILVTSNGGETLSGGLGPRLTQFDVDPVRTATRSTWAGAGKWIPMGQSGYLSADEMRRLPYDRQDALLRERALAWAWNHPGDAAWIELCKLGYMWGVYRMGANGAVQMLFGNVAIIALLLVSAAALASRRGLARRMARLWLVPLFVSGVALISWGSWRFREPADAALIALATIGWWPLLVRAAGVKAEGRAE